MPKGFVIAIDGPVAAGKGTLASLLAEKLHGFYLQTGAMYRSVAFFGIKNNIDLHDYNKVVALLPSLTIQFHDTKVVLNGKDVTEQLRREDVAAGASLVATYPKVRKDMVQRQQEIANQEKQKGKIILAEGRDTATVVFPQAELKIFLTAKPEIRATRRFRELNEKGEKNVNFESVLQAIYNRDKQDRERDTDPLVATPEKYGYFVLDDSEMTKAQTVEVVLHEIQKKMLV